MSVTRTTANRRAAEARGVPKSLSGANQGSYVVCTMAHCRGPWNLLAVRILASNLAVVVHGSIRTYLVQSILCKLPMDRCVACGKWADELFLLGGFELKLSNYLDGPSWSWLGRSGFALSLRARLRA